MDTLAFIMTFEGGEATSEEIIDGFANLISTGTAWSLQGSYGRTAVSLIGAGYIDTAGNVLTYPEEF